MPQWLLVFMVFMPVVGHGADPHDRAMQLRRAGAIVPLEDLLLRIRQQFACRLLDAHIENDGTRYLYKVKVLDQDSRVHELEFDGVSGELIHFERGP